MCVFFNSVYLGILLTCWRNHTFAVSRRLTFVVAESGLSFIQKSGAGEHFAAHQGSQCNCDTSSPHILSSSHGVPFTRGRCSADCFSAGTTNLRNFARMHRHQPCRRSILVVCPAFSRCTHTEGNNFQNVGSSQESHTSWIQNRVEWCAAESMMTLRTDTRWSLERFQVHD